MTFAVGHIGQKGEKMDDLIKRAEAIDVLNVGAELLRRVLDDTDIVGIERKKYEWGLGLIELYIFDMKELSPAQPERKKGKWVGYDGDWLKTMCKCSECGAMIDINEKYRNFFCYHCGADMRGNKNESEVFPR